MNILENAIDSEGSVGKLANALDVRQNVVSNWRKRGLPKPWAKVLEMKYTQPKPLRKKPAPQAAERAA